jgi:hypothetical protein
MNNDNNNQPFRNIIEQLIESDKALLEAFVILSKHLEKHDLCLEILKEEILSMKGLLK